MPLPDFQDIMLPMLRLAGDGQEHALSDARAQIAETFRLTPEDLAQRLPSGVQTVWANRVAWAKVHLDRAGLLHSVRRGVFAITERGRQVLATPPDRITVKLLRQYPEFAAFVKRPAADGPDPKPVSPEVETPEELLEDAYAEIRRALGADLLARVKTASPQFFEELVVELLLQMGYGGSRAEAGEAIGRGGDEGIDGVIREDRLGLDVIYIQAKRWDGSVGRPEIQKFIGALHGKHARKGVFITTGTFTADARAYVQQIDARVVLIDGRQLAEYMIDFNVGVTTKSTYYVKRIDGDYFVEE
jgi:restriction system protein